MNRILVSPSPHIHAKTSTSVLMRDVVIALLPSVIVSILYYGAAAIGRAQTVGSLEPGKLGDLVLWEAADLEYLCYRLGSNLVNTVIKRGRPHMYGGPKGPGRENVWQN